MLMEIFQENNVLIDLAVWSCNLSSKGGVAKCECYSFKENVWL